MDTIGQADVIGLMERQIAQLPDGRKTFFEATDFPWTRAVEAHAGRIREELERLMTAVELLPGFEEIQSEQTLLTTDKRWKIFPLYTYGTWYNEHRCAATVEALRCIPDLKAAMFSILQANKEIPPHRGPYSGVLRYHLGLQIPDPALAGIRVGGDTRHWEEGKSLIFDDSHDHAAWNRSTGDRIVLFVDFARPLPPSLRPQNEFVIQQISKSDFIVQAAARWKAWEAQHGATIDAHIGA